MDSRLRKKLIFPTIIDEIKKSENKEQYTYNFDKLLCIFLAPILFFSAVALVLFGLFIEVRPIMGIIIDFSIMSIFFFINLFLLSGEIKKIVKHHMIAILYNMVFLFAIVRFYPVVGPALWSFAFIQVVLSLSQNSKIMLRYTAANMIIAATHSIFNHMTLSFEINVYYVFVQLGLFILMFFVVRVIYTINQSQLERLKDQVDELKSESDKRKKAQAKSNYLENYDQLTGLPNKNLFSKRLRNALEYCKNHDSKLHVLYIDLDQFKLINDTLGRKYGDELLKEIGDRLYATIKGDDTLCRISADEFLYMINDSDEDIAENKAFKILNMINKPYIIEGEDIRVTCSIGISKFPEDGADVESLIKRADIAMYKAKEDGKDNFEKYSHELEKVRNEELEIVNSLKNALDNDELLLYYQPQVDGVTQEILGLEALIRWQHPKLGLISAGRFIPIAEKSGLIVKIGEWVLETACRQNKKWQDEGKKAVPVAVNISISQIKEYNLYNLVKNVLKKTGLKPQYLELEITESILVKETSTVKQNLNKIREMGVKIAIDDFGTGYSAIQYLRHLPIDRLKIPMNFIHGINKSDKDESIINVILTLAQSLDIGLVAEGVETEGQLEFLTQRNCNVIQGYYFFKPMSVAELSGYLLECLVS